MGYEIQILVCCIFFNSGHRIFLEIKGWHSLLCHKDNGSTGSPLNLESTDLLESILSVLMNIKLQSIKESAYIALEFKGSKHCAVGLCKN